MNVKTCAATDRINRWEDIDFHIAQDHVKKLQRRIAEAYRQDAQGKVVFLQHNLIHSFYAKALAVQMVTTRKGKYTPGIDDTLWLTPDVKWQSISDLTLRGYRPDPCRRSYIMKPDGRMRPLSIPTMKDRAMQTLYKFALEPIAEATGDLHSYGFREGRSTKDAILRCMEVLSKPPYPKWILEADIKACFDNISHDWVMEHIPMKKNLLQGFLESGYIEDGILYPTERGIPQGGSLSTVICNMVLDGLERLLEENFSDRVQFVRYADDFIVTGTDKSLLENAVIPLVNEFLSHRGLQLSSEKTIVTHIEDGFDFLGWTMYKDRNYLTVTPSEKNVNSLLSKIEDVICTASLRSNEELYEKFKSIIAGWVNYHRNVVIPQSLYGVEFEIYSYLYTRTKDKHLTGIVSSIFNSI